MNEKRQILLLKAMKNNGRINVATANRLYSGNGGKDALISLEFQGYLENAGFGNFRINEDKQFPQELVRRFKEWEDSQSDGGCSDSGYEGSVEKSVEVP
jgi:hypothetical protein